MLKEIEMKKIILKTFAILTLSLMIFVSACSKDDGGGSVPTAPEVVNNSGGNESGSGVSGNPDITVEEGRIVLTLTSGKISLDGVSVQLATYDSEAKEWKLVEGITVKVLDEQGNEITGTIYIDPTTGKVYFIPNEGFDTGKSYTIIVEINGKQYKAVFVLAVDDTCKSNSMFAPVLLRDKSTYTVNQLISNGKAIFGWEFGSYFRIKMSGLEAGAKVLLTAFGVYDISGHECEVYYQRWKSTGKPVENYEWSGTAIKIDETDSSLDGPNGDPDYSFKKTYFVLKVMKDGEDITSTTQAKIIVY